MTHSVSLTGASPLANLVTASLKIEVRMISESQLFECMEASSDGASVKVPQTGQYTFSNTANAALFGFSTPRQVIGLTVDALHFSKTQHGEAWTRRIKEMDYLAQAKRCSVEDTHAYINQSGVLVYKTTTKRPLIGLRGTVLGIITLSHDLTHCLSHRLLYFTYKEMGGKKMAIAKTLRHLGIDDDFFMPPTEMELLTMLEHAAGKSNKAVANTLGVSVRTIETHMAHLRIKLDDGGLSRVISRLRNRAPIIDAL
jgi:DNA-binding CsgD family transcriptional regulator